MLKNFYRSNSTLFSFRNFNSCYGKCAARMRARTRNRDSIVKKSKVTYAIFRTFEEEQVWLVKQRS
jgi:hypothetical protein